MKNVSYLLIASVLMLCSCGTSPEKEDANRNDKRSTARKVVDRPSDCDDFLEEYELWSERYIEVIKTFRKSPGNPEMAKRFNTVSGELSLWTRDWKEFTLCSEDVEYQKRYNSIQKEIKKEQKRLEGV